MMQNPYFYEIEPPAQSYFALIPNPPFMSSPDQPRPESRFRCLVFMGVSGSGKSAVASSVAEALSLPLLEGDSFHSPENREKMARGTPLNDQDREGWLQSLNREMLNLESRNQSLVVACSALKESYRRILTEGLDSTPWWFLLHGPVDLIRQRMDEREHFFSSELLQSQVEALEMPPYAYTLDIHKSVGELTEEILRLIRDPS